MSGPTIVQIRKASAYEIILVAASGIASVLNLIDPNTQSRVLAAALNADGVLIYYSVGCIVGAVAVLVGSIWTERGLRSDCYSPSMGLVIERAGLWILGPLLIAYGVAVLAATPVGAFAGGIAAAVGAAHLMRAVRIGVDLATLRKLGEKAPQ